MYKRVVFGDVANDHVAELEDINGPRVRVPRCARPICVLAMGLYPKPIADVLHAPLLTNCCVTWQ